MFIGKYELTGDTYFSIYYKNKEGYDLWKKDTWSPCTKNIETLDFKLNGKTYQEKKNSLIELAKEWQLRFWQYSWSYGELAEIETIFWKMQKGMVL